MQPHQQRQRQLTEEQQQIVDAVGGMVLEQIRQLQQFSNFISGELSFIQQQMAQIFEILENQQGQQHQQPPRQQVDLEADDE